jgi:hypothetical protein
MTTIIFALALDLSGTIITLQPTEEPGAVAEVEMRNVPTNSDAENGEYPLTLGDLTVTAEFLWNSGPAGADSIIVTPPEGVICKPETCVLELQEGYTGTLWLFDWRGM